MEKQNLNLEGIKVGEMYNVLMQESDYADGIIFCSTVIGIDPKDGVQCGEEYEICHDEISAFSPVSPANGIKNTETAPKYDPNRLFRKGDKVKAVVRHGRIPNDGVPKDVILEVIADERDSIVKVLHKMGAILEIFNVYALSLELVTPVEELEPYDVDECCFAPTLYVRKNGKVYLTIPYKEGTSLFQTREQALAAAEAERDRLNAEYRKEQGND